MTAVGGPREFGRYALLDRLGSGGMADVFLALASGQFDAKKLVVLKCPRAFDHEYAQMFMDEARLAMRLSHPTSSRPTTSESTMARSSWRWSTSKASRSIT